MRYPALILAPALLLAAAAGATAQLSVEPAVALNSAFVWRGLTIVNRPVVQPEIGVAAGPAYLGVWGSLEPASYHGDDVISVLGGRHAPGLGEVDLTAELSHTVRALSFTVGGIGYLYTHAASYETEANTAELFGKVALDGPLPLELAAYQDLRSVRGTYLELSAERSVPRLPLVLAARAGASFGEQEGPRTSYFERDGFTHLELSAALPLDCGAISLRPSATLVTGFDGETRVVAADGRLARTKAWFGISIAPRRGAGE